MKKREKRRNARHLSCSSATKRLTLKMMSMSGCRSYFTKIFSYIMFIAVICLAFLSSVLSVTKEAQKNNYTYFEEKNTHLYFSHLTVNTYTGQVYVGGVNRIYQLSPQLTLEAIAIMGPKEDSPDCPVTKNCPSVVKKPTIYCNKVLVIDYAQSRLLTCGSLFQGVCSVHKLDNVSSYESPAFVSVAANNAIASTVAFIAAGPQKSPKHVLYVGVSYTANGPYRSNVPAVSSRSLDPNAMFTIAATGVTTGTRFLMNSLARDRYPITYIYGFQSRGFTYFLTIQKKSAESSRPFISKLVRICQKDADYYSYTEIPIMCRTLHDNNDYNLAQAAFVGIPGSELATSLGITAQDDILFIVFAKSKDEADVYNKPSANSALCVYALSAIHRKFTQNIQHCFNGNGNQGLDFINIIQPCVPTQVQINDNFCGMDINAPLGGSMPIEAAPVISYNNQLLKSVAATSTHDFTVVFLGTDSGHLKKAVVESSLSAFEFSDIAIEEGSPVNPDMYFVDLYNKNYLYVMTMRRVTLVKVQECQIYRTCTECLGARDPYCGWCSLENKCLLRSDCTEATQDPLYWLSYKSGKCTIITHVHPPQIQRTTARTLILVIDNLPVLEGQFFCAFTNATKTLITNATRSANGVSCPTPPTDSIPPVSPGQHYFTAKLSVRMKVGPDFVRTDFTFYDCSSYSSCTQCVLSSFSCDWCVGGHRCTHDTGENCRNDILVTGVSSVGPSIRSGPGFCPRINATSGGTTEVLVPSGISKSIQVKVDNIPQFIVSTRFICQFNIEGRVKQVNAQLLGDTIYCEGLEFTYGTNQSNITAAFAVIWDGSKPLDNPENIHVLVYRCQGMASNCGFCLELPEKYSCGWCQEIDSCQVQEQCRHHNTMWLNGQQTCPDPKILDFYPKSGPWEGGTNVTIEGINLGRTYEDIATGVGISHEVNGVTLGVITCTPHREDYVKTAKIKCIVQSPRNLTTGHQTQLGSISGPVIVKVLNDYIARSKEFYSFVNPKILTISPTKGPTSGGTKLSIEGLHMDAGSKVEAFLGSLMCNVTRRTINFAECITSARHMPGKEKVRVKFDNGLRFFDYYNYLYVEDPKINSVESGSGGNRGEARGIPSGGITLIVRGNHLNIIQKPMMYVDVDGELYSSNCTSISAVEMKCESPSVPIEKLDYPEDKEYVELDYGFIMDNVKSVMNLSTRKSNPFATFRMYRNPYFQPFTEENGIKFYRSEYLTINGKNLDGGFQESDVTVWIGTSTCNVTSLSRSQLTFRPPTSQPLSDGNSDSIPKVIVGIGGKLNFTIGKLSYDTNTGTPEPIQQHILIVLIIVICILFLIVVFILILYRNKSSKIQKYLNTPQIDKQNEYRMSNFSDFNAYDVIENNELALEEYYDNSMEQSIYLEVHQNNEDNAYLPMQNPLRNQVFHS